MLLFFMVPGIFLDPVLSCAPGSLPLSVPGLRVHGPRGPRLHLHQQDPAGPLGGSAALPRSRGGHALPRPVLQHRPQCQGYVL